MFKVNIYDTLNGNFLKRELFKEKPHALNWITENEIKTGFHYELVDLSLDNEWLESDVKEKRKKEYPPIADVVEALWEYFIEDKNEKLQEVQLKREEIKTKYPKPIKGN